MNHANKKLMEYGFIIQLSDRKFKHFTNKMFTEHPDDSTRAIYLTQNLRLILDDVKRFKKQFDIPKKYDVLTDILMGSTSIQSKAEGEMYFCRTEFSSWFSRSLFNLINDEREMFLKANKQFKLKSSFTHNQADAWLANELTILYKELLKDPATRPARQRLYEELTECLLKDKAVWEKELFSIHNKNVRA